jgi:hypothetical protein
MSTAAFAAGNDGMLKRPLKQSVQETESSLSKNATSSSQHHVTVPKVAAWQRPL